MASSCLRYCAEKWHCFFIFCLLFASVGELGVQLVTQKEDLDDTSKGLLEDEQFLKDHQPSIHAVTQAKLTINGSTSCSLEIIFFE